PLFGDAGSATAIEWKENIQSWKFELGSDGSGAENIMIPGGHCRVPFSSDQLADEEISVGITRNKLNLKLNGEEVFYFSVNQVPPAVKKLLTNSNITFENIDYWIMHQANKIMNETIRI